MDFTQTPLPFIVMSLGAVWMFIEGIALSRGVAWAYRAGLPLPWREEVVDLAVPREAIDVNDRLDREGSFETDDDYRSAFYLDLDTVGLLYWAVSFGARNTLKIKPLRGLGVVATGVVEVVRGEASTRFRWRPVLRLGPIASAVSVSWLIVAQSGMHAPFGMFFTMIGVVYLGMLWWSLRQLGGMYESISAQLVRRASEAQAEARR